MTKYVVVSGLPSIRPALAGLPLAYGEVSDDKAAELVADAIVRPEVILDAPPPQAGPVTIAVGVPQIPGLVATMSVTEATRDRLLADGLIQPDDVLA